MELAFKQTHYFESNCHIEGAGFAPYPAWKCDEWNKCDELINFMKYKNSSNVK